MPLILRLLAWLIVFYRTWLSGRGPLRGVRCSFAPHESCSAFGLRAMAESSTARIALRRIAARIRRCRDACLVSDGRALSWSELHDRAPSEIAVAMRADGEGVAAIEVVLRVRRAVAIWRADSAAVRACDALLVEAAALTACDELSAPTVPAPAPRVVAEPRDGLAPRVVAEPAIRSRARRRLAILGGVALAAAAVVFLLPWVGGLSLGLAATAGILSARTTFARERRFELHRTWARRRSARDGLSCSYDAG